MSASRRKKLSLSSGFAGAGESEDIKEVPLSLIDLPQYQPRSYFAQESLDELVASIKVNGVLQPVLVRPTSGGRYELLAGGRRYRASQSLSLDKIPAVVRELDDQQALAASITENLLREDLNPVEETEGVLKLIALRFNLTAEEVSPFLNNARNQKRGRQLAEPMPQSTLDSLEELFKELGRLSLDSFTSHRLPLLKLPPDVLEALKQGKLAYTKGVAIARVKQDKARSQILNQAVNESLSLSDINRRIRDIMPSKGEKRGDQFQQQLTKLAARVKNSAVLEDESKHSRLKELLQELENLLS